MLISSMIDQQKKMLLFLSLLSEGLPALRLGEQIWEEADRLYDRGKKFWNEADKLYDKGAIFWNRGSSLLSKAEDLFPEAYSFLVPGKSS